MLQAEQGYPDWDFLAFQAGRVLDFGLTHGWVLQKAALLLHRALVWGNNTGPGCSLRISEPSFPAALHRNTTQAAGITIHDNFPSLWREMDLADRWTFHIAGLTRDHWSSNCLESPNLPSKTPASKPRHLFIKQPPASPWHPLPAASTPRTIVNPQTCSCAIPS